MITTTKEHRITATRVRALRLSRLLSQAELARRAGITEATLSRLERGERSPYYKTLAKLAKALHVSARSLVDDLPLDGDQRAGGRAD